MKCFNHPEIDAVGICKSCNKGLCHECAADTGNGIACKDKCEDEVKMINQLVDRNKNIYHRSKQSYKIVSLIYFVFAIAFFGVGWMMKEVTLYTSLVALLFFVLAVYQFFIGSKITQVKK